VSDGLFQLLRSGWLRVLERSRHSARGQVRGHERGGYRTAHQRRFRKPRDRQCPFLEDHRCAIHPAKPTQCRTFPFWPELVEDRKAWANTGKYCPGIGTGELIQIGTAMEIAEQHRRAYPEDYS
jgi:Fe-S-cluster containining protein